MRWEAPDCNEYLVGPAINATLTAYPLPRPPPSEYENLDAVDTIRSRPDLFKIVTPINADRFRDILRNHPNQAFVESVYLGLIEGFWPLADTRSSGAPDSADYSGHSTWTGDKLAFYRTTCDEEVADGRWSHDFGPDLLPGMYSSPIFAVPKPHTSKFRMVVDHSAGEHSLNSFISRERVSTKLDNVRDLGHFLRVERTRTGQQLRLFKCDASKAYRRAPAHPLWQIKQVVSVNGERRVDRCCNFGTKSAGDIFFSIMALVLWAAQFEYGIEALLGYVDDVFSFDDFAKLVLYRPYNRLMCPKQSALLHLWDHIGLPHSNDKQQSGAVLTILGLDVDPNCMTVTMPNESRLELIDKLEDFVSSRGAQDDRKRPLVEWQRVLGYANWALNAYPLLRPALSSSYDKIRGKSGAHWPVILNTQVVRDLSWFAAMLRVAPGIQVLGASDWGPEDADLTLVCDASLSGLGFWTPDELLGFHAIREDPSIIFNECLCTLAALQWAVSAQPAARRIAIFTDSQVSVELHSNLAASPLYNSILFAAAEIMLCTGVSVQVWHIPGDLNSIADALSRGKLDEALMLAPELHILPFTPPVVSPVTPADAKVAKCPLGRQSGPSDTRSA